eukprot:NODE_19091_length_860_cov_5.536153.p4 GENE.NODE_19091_length_860_cov_5.536153~~NODE_19091_length_860_cov_5.536153.p4  ORF type:complete len:85 (+),score=2.38 NODE_19091_length_860_cov_5.536153:236-490(+)
MVWEDEAGIRSSRREPLRKMPWRRQHTERVVAYPGANCPNWHAGAGSSNRERETFIQDAGGRSAGCELWKLPGWQPRRNNARWC